MVNCRITGLFWNVSIDDINKSVEVTQKREFMNEVVNIKYYFSIDIFEDECCNEVIRECIRIASTKLLVWLKENYILNFFPAKRVSIDYDSKLKEHNISICYYQNDSMYDIVYGQIEKTGYIMQPNQIIWNRLEQFYDSYCLDFDPLAVYE